MERVIMGMVGEDSADDIVESPMREMLGGLEPAGVTFWSGAGISMAPPTSLLGGIELTEKLIEWAFDDAPLDALVGTRGQDGRRQRTGLYAELGIDRVMPRLEVVLGVASEPGCHGKLAFDFVLGPMAAVEPNAAHRFLHAHVSRGGHHMTANFDTCIERAGPDDVRDSVLHFHGSVDDEAETLGATFRNIENGFKPDVEHSFLRFLTAAKTVIVVGYSGSDVFDVARLLGELADNGQPLKSVRVLWVDYADHCIELAPEWSPPDDVLGSVEAFLAEERVPWTARQIDSLRDAGADVRRVVGDPAEIYEFLTSAWQLEIDPTKPTAAAPTPTPMSIPKAEEDGRISAAVRLWLTLGVPRRALNLMEANPTLFPSAEIQEARAAIAWRSGRYRTAAKIWRSARPRGTAAERAAWSERQVACLWVAGRFVPALVLARLAIRRAIDNDVVNVELYELWARILQHMRRTPDLKLIGRWGQRKAVVELDKVLASRSVGEHAAIRLTSARNSLTASGSDGEQLTTARARFAEAESLSGVVSFRHGRLRASLAAGDRRFAELLQLQQSWAALLDAQGDANRAAFLPGVPGLIGRRQCVRAAFANQYGWWHRCRLLGRSFIR